MVSPPNNDNDNDPTLPFISATRFHNRLLLPSSDPATPRYVSYSLYGCAHSDNVVLLCGGLMGGRLAYCTLDALAKKHGVRILHADRPGMGGSSGVEDVGGRVGVWVEMIPHLLSHLQIRSVSLAAHSFGTIYAVNMMLVHPHLLHGDRPYVAFFAPWVHPSHSRVAHLLAAGLLPGDLIARLGGVARWVNGTVVPVVGMSAGLSGGVVEGVKGSFGRRRGRVGGDVEGGVVEGNSVGDNNNDDDYTLDLDNEHTVNQLRNHIVTFLFAENTDGIGQDAQLCLKKPRSVPWCSPNVPWSDMDDAVPLLSRLLTEAGRTCTVDVFHAETDVMVGEKGRLWFDSCWTGVEGQETEARGFEYRSRVVEGADHDFILDPVFGASEVWLRRVGEAFADRAESE